MVYYLGQSFIIVHYIHLSFYIETAPLEAVWFGPAALHWLFRPILTENFGSLQFNLES